MSQDETLFAGEENGGVAASEVLVPRADLLVGNSEQEFPAVNLIEANLHLISCLNAIAGANMRAGLEQAGERVLDPNRYGSEVAAVMRGAERNRHRLTIEAKEHFAAAYGLSMVNEAEPNVDHTDDIRAAYQEFVGEHATSHQVLARHRTVLRRRVAELASRQQPDDPLQFVTLANRTLGLRPHARQSVESKSSEGQLDEAFKTIDARGRLEVLLYDPRGGFTPSTRQELNTVTSWLDYLDNPDHPLGTVDQLLEVSLHQRKPDGRSEQDGIRAVESITWEIGDCAIDATQALVAIEQLASDLEDVRPDLELAELDEITIDHPALPYIFQYFDMEEFIETGVVMGLRQIPLRTRALRLTDETGQELHGNIDGKHKIVHSQYTTPERTDAYQKHFEQRMGMRRRGIGLQVKDVREAVQVIQERQTIRLSFMLQRLEDIRSGFYHEHTQTDQGVGILRAVEDSENMVAAIYAQATEFAAAA